MTALAAALGQGSEKTLLPVSSFLGDGSQDLEEWLDEFHQAGIANKWTAARGLKLVPVYLKGVALDWYRSLNPAPNAFDDPGNAGQSFKHLFRARFHTTKQKALWQKQFFEIKQGPDTVDAYISHFRTLKKRVDPTNAFPVGFTKQLFIQGLRPELAINVQASEPVDEAAAMVTAKRWETGHIMANQSASETDQAIRQLTDQIAKLSINLAQQQQLPQAQSTNYASTSSTNTSQNQEPRRCHYCGQTGHLIAKCRTRQAEQKSRDDRRNDRRNNYKKDDYRRDERRRSRSRSRDRSYRSSSRDRRNFRENSRERSRYTDFYNNDSRRTSFRSPSPYHRDINYLGHDSTPPSTSPVSSNNKWKHFLDNPFIRIAMAAYLYEEAKKTDLLPISHTTPVKCNIRLRNRPYQAIIDSGAAISMIAHQTVKELDLKIEQASTSLIVTATGTSTRPLGIIRDLPVEIEGVTIPITVEVVPATSYSLLLGNDWSKKVGASYNWNNSCYSFKWKNKKISVPTTYESNHPLPAQPTITNPKELELFEQEYLTP